MIESGLFFIFSFLAVFCALLVITVKNPVHSVLALVMTFFNAAGIFMLLGAEFLSMSLIIVYVGAVAILFLFIVMMLDINFTVIKQGFVRYLPLGLLVGAVLFTDLFLMFKISSEETIVRAAQSFPTPDIATLTNTKALGSILYTDYAFPFQIAGLILMLAMIGSIVLTLRTREHVKKQDVVKQLGRDPKKSVELVNVKVGAGIDGHSHP